MVAAQPNRARLSGTVERVAVTEDCPSGWTELQLRVSRSDPVGDLANMLRDAADTSITLIVTVDDIADAGVTVGDGVTVDARKVTPRRTVAERATLRRVDD